MYKSGHAAGADGNRRRTWPAFLAALLIGAAAVTMGCADEATPAPTPQSPAAAAPAPTLTPTPEPTPAIIVQSGAQRTGTPTPASEPTAVPVPIPTRVIPPTPKRTEVVPTATATPAPFARLDVDIHRETRWRDLLDGLYPHERSCIEVEAGPDGLDMPILLELQFPLDKEVAMFGCLEPGTARAVLLGATVAAIQEEDDLRIAQDELACVRNVLTGMDAAAVVAAMVQDAEDRLPAGEFMAGFFRCISKTLANLYAAMGTPKDSEDRMDCARKVLEGVDAEIMVALMWEEETREAEEFISALMDCIPIEDEYEGTRDDHADWIGDATVVEVGHTLPAAVEYEHDVDTFAFVAEGGTIYQIGVGLGTLEDVWISLYGAFPDYDELHTASSHDNGQVTSIFWQSPYTDMVFVSVSGEDGTGDYSFFVQPVRLQDDHANIRGKGTALAVGQEAWGELEFYSDVDAFRMEVQEGTVYEMTVELWTLEEASLHVEDIYGKVVASGTGRNRNRASAVWKAEMTGFHYILVQGDSTGTYSLSAKAWQDDHGDSSETATPLQIGEYVKSRIDTGQDIDYFVFQADEGTSYLIESELGDLAAIALTLLDRRGEIASDDNYRRAGQPARIHWEASTHGEYWIAANGRGPGWEGSTGTYGIVVKETTQPEQ